MKIITPKGQFDTDTEGIVLMFINDDELSSFISMIVKTPVKSSGIRILPLIPANFHLTPILSAIEELDGVGGKDHEEIIDNSIDILKSILHIKGLEKF